MSYSEAALWSRYISKRGSLHFGRRIEASQATIAGAIYRVNGWKFNSYDLAPHEVEPVYTSDDIKRMRGGR